jgi:hypothetical protein
VREAHTRFHSAAWIAVEQQALRALLNHLKAFGLNSVSRGITPAWSGDPSE